MTLAFKRIARPPDRVWQTKVMCVGALDFDREDDVQDEDGIWFTLPHRRSFREVITTAHADAQSWHRLGNTATIIDVELDPATGAAAVQGQEYWLFTFRFLDYPRPYLDGETKLFLR